MKQTSPNLLRVDQVAKRLNCSARHIYNLVERGDLEATCIGRGKKGIRIFETALNRFIEDRRRDPLVQHP